jgi:DnaA family protein
VDQLVLDFLRPPAPTLDNFVPGGNQEALATLRSLMATGAHATSRALYLWGPPGCGRSHLLQALASVRPAPAACLLGPQSAPEAFMASDGGTLWLLDDIDQLDATRQEAAFHLFNAVMARPDTAFVACGDRPPATLPVMPELASRLAWGLVLELRPLSDADTAQALTESLTARGVAASADLVPWLMTHAPRHLGRLRALIDALDVYALSRKRALTLPLLREFVRQAGAPDLP